MGSGAKIPELAFLAFHNRSFMPFSAHHFCQETIFAPEPLFPSFVDLHTSPTSLSVGSIFQLPEQAATQLKSENSGTPGCHLLPPLVLATVLVSLVSKKDEL